MTKNPSYLVIDLFCGAGGVTTGFVLAGGIAKVIACVNHDHKAILSHWANHPDVRHFEEDIRTLELSPLIQLTTDCREQYPEAQLILWASLECTNFSKAKGGLARDADSRTLADHLHRYILALDPDFVMIENVVEFLDWGPSRVKVRDGKNVRVKNKHGEMIDGHEPIPETKGQDFKRWCNEICAHGYTEAWGQMNSADFGAFTSRNRLFGIFSKDESDIAWPMPTHAKGGKNGLPKWKPVKEKIDFTDEGYSIFNRSSNQNIPARQRIELSENTYDRVYAGCIKQIAGGKDAFMVKYHGGPPRIKSIDEPLTVIDTQNRHAFVSVYHGNGDNTHSMEGPMPTITAADINAAVFLNRNFKTATSSSIEDPAGAITAVPKLDMIQAEAFIDSTQYQNVPRSVNEPCSTITANRKYPYLLTLQWGGTMRGVDQPARTILATSHKSPEYLVLTEQGEYAIEIYEADSPAVKKLKEFMALYGIVDIKMRMLRVDELLRIQGFPDTYNLLGTQSDQKKFIGNSVVPHVVKAWIEALEANRIEKAKLVPGKGPFRLKHVA